MLRISGFTLLLLLSGCGSDGSSTKPDTLADLTTIKPHQISEFDHHSSVFISSLNIDVDSELLKSLTFMVEPKDDAKAEPIQVTYPINQLEIDSSGINLPVFGLYSGFDNTVELTFTFTDDSEKAIDVTLTTDEYIDVLSTYDNVVQITEPQKAPSFSYFLIKGHVWALPVIMDIDGNVRWAVHQGVSDGMASLFFENHIYTHSGNKLIKRGLDGSESRVKIPETWFYGAIEDHHNLEKGKVGLLAEVDVTRKSDNQRLIESVIFEIDPVDAEVLEIWDLGHILTAHMTSSAYHDDPSNFVKDGQDWCHINSAIYDASSDAIVASCRENFIISIDYQSKRINWLFGDITKKWFQYNSLADLALMTDDYYPMGQHALSLEGDYLTFFNNGMQSFNHNPAGDNLTSSQPGKYKLKLDDKEAELVWGYDDGKYGQFCSSIYQDGDDDYLINYAHDNTLNDSDAYILGVNKNQDVLFEFRLPRGNSQCATSHNVTFIDDLTKLTF